MASCSLSDDFIILKTVFIEFFFQGILGTYFYLDSVGSALAASVKWLPLVTLIIFFLSYDLGKSSTLNVNIIKWNK